jgi:PAS domain S-box-containing protein
MKAEQPASSSHGAPSRCRHETAPSALAPLCHASRSLGAHTASALDLCLLQGVLESIPIPVFIRDRDCRFADCNDAFLEFMQMPRQRVVGANSADLFPADLAIVIDQRIRELLDGGNAQSELLSIPTSQGMRRIWVRRQALASGGEIIGLVGTLIDRTEELAAREALEASEARYRGLFESSLDAVLLIEKHSFIDCNSAACEMFGCDREELIGHTPIEFSPPTQYDGNPSPVKAAEMIAGATSGERQYFEWLHWRKDHTLFDAEVCLTPVKDSGGCQIRAQVRDVTEHRRAQEALRASESFSRGIVDHSPVGIIYLDASGRILHENPAMKRILGVPPGQESPALGQRLQDLPNVGKHAAAPVVERVLKGEVVRGVEVQFTSIFGIDSYFQLHAAPHTNEQGEVTGAVLMCLDISELRSLEAQLRHTQKMEAVGTLAGGIAHDFNNILTGILGNADLALLHLGDGERVRSDLEEIVKSVQRAATLIRRLLAFSRKQTADARISDLNAIIADFGQMMRRVIGEQIAMTWLPGTELWHARVDPAQIEQIVVNLVINSRDAMPSGGQLTIATRNLSLREPLETDYGEIPAGEHVVLSVEDNGSGMDAVIRKRIFDPFFTTKPPGKGTGLGLSMVYGIVHQGGGALTVESRPGEGTKIQVFFPRAHGELEPRTDLFPAALTAASGSESILVVEDEETVRLSSVRVLRYCGYTVYAATHGRAALEILAESPVDLVVSDVIMPELSGPQLAREVRNRWPETAFLFTSGYTRDVWDRDELGSESTQLLPKPFTANDLLRAVRRVLEQRNKSTHPPADG